MGGFVAGASGDQDGAGRVARGAPPPAPCSVHVKYERQEPLWPNCITLAHNQGPAELVSRMTEVGHSKQQIIIVTNAYCLLIRPSLKAILKANIFVLH